MSLKINKSQIERFSRQIILKKIGSQGQKKIIESKVLIIGMGGLGCPVAEFLTRAGVGTLGIVDYDIIDLSNIHRQSLYDSNDIKKNKVKIAKIKLKKINPHVNINTYNVKLDKKNSEKIIKNYDYIIDGTDNFKSKFLINDCCLKQKKLLISGAISKFDGHVFVLNSNSKKNPCLRCFFQEEKVSEDVLDCEFEGVLGTIANIVGTIQANEVLKHILRIGKSLNGFILILDLLNLNFRKVKFKKINNCLCNKI